MYKVRWLQSEFPVPFDEVSSVISKNKYNDSIGNGFILSKKNQSALKGRFVEKRVDKVVTIDPFGSEIESTEVTYYTCRFELSSKNNLITIFEPPRTLRSFMSKMHELFGLGVVIAELKVKPLHWLDEIKSDFDKVTVKHISAFGMRVPPNGLAKLSVSGKADIRQEFNSLVGSNFHSIDCVKFECRFQDVFYSVELNKTGSLKIKNNPPDDMLELCKCYLHQIMM